MAAMVYDEMFPVEVRTYKRPGSSYQAQQSSHRVPRAWCDGSGLLNAFLLPYVGVDDILSFKEYVRLLECAPPVKWCILLPSPGAVRPCPRFNNIYFISAFRWCRSTAHSFKLILYCSSTCVVFYWLYLLISGLLAVRGFQSFMVQMWAYYAEFADIFISLRTMSSQAALVYSVSHI